MNLETNQPGAQSEQKTLYAEVMQLGAAVLFVSLVIVAGAFVHLYGAEESNNGSAVASTNTTLTASVSAAIAGGFAQKAGECVDGAAESCRNKCATTYLVVSNDRYAVRDCYTAGGDASPAKAVAELRSCIERETGPLTGDSGVYAKDPVKEALCMADIPKIGEIDEENGTFEFIEVPGSRTPLPVPASCKKQLETVLELRMRTSAHTTATGLDAQLCANRGSVVCYPSDFANTARGYTCVFKDSTTAERIAVGRTSTSGTNCSQGSATQRAQCRAQEILNERKWSTYGLIIGQTIGQGLSVWLFGSGSTGTSGQGGGTQQCRSGYTKTVQNGRVVCTRTAVKPQCVFSANKEDILSGETVILKWSTKNAQRVNVTGVGNNLSPNGEATVKPTKTTVYTLTAIGTGSGADSTEMCETTVVVDGAGVTGPTGSAPPQLSCTPNPLQKGRSSTIRWACTSAAVKSGGVGIDTGGRISGEATVSPNFNTGYAVTCLNEDDEEIGRNTCALTVGESIYDIVVEPEMARRGDRVRVSWSSLFMKSCRVTGPRGFDYSNTQGVVITEPFSASENTVSDQQIRAAIYTLECESQFGGAFTKDVSVQFEASTN